MTPKAEYTENAVLCMSIDAGATKWALAFTRPGESRISETSIGAGDAEALQDRIVRARKRFGLPEGTRLVSCYEAGRDGFWIHRFLVSKGIENVVVHAASIKVDQQARRAKTDRLDAKQLVRDLARHVRGDNDVWKVVRVPTVEEEDRRRSHRELSRLKGERTQHLVRIRSLLVLHGVRVERLRQMLGKLEDVRTWDNVPLPEQLTKEIVRERERLWLVDREIREIEEAWLEQLDELPAPLRASVQKLAALRGVGMDSARLLTLECFGWRKFQNRKQVAGSAGLCGTPYASGSKSQEQGIGKNGNPRVRARMVELAWKWIQWQPQSDLSQWFLRRFAGGSGRVRRIGIVAVARRLLVDLWRYIEHDVPPPRAILAKRILVVAS